MNDIEPKDIAKLATIDDASSFQEVRNQQNSGIVIIPERYGNSEETYIKADGGDFTKWLVQEKPDISVQFPSGKRKVSLHSAEYWLPLVYLANDIALPTYLSLVANYLYDKIRGALTNEKKRINFSVVSEDRSAGKLKRFDFSGDYEGLQKIVKKFDLNQFLDD